MAVMRVPSFSMAAWVAGAWRGSAGLLASMGQSIEPFDLTGMEASRKLRELHSLQVVYRYAAQACGRLLIYNVLETIITRKF